MISKVITGNGSFYGVCRYVMSNEKRAEIITSKGVRDFDYRLTANDFDQICNYHPARSANILHAILSFPKNEKHENSFLKQIGEDYLSLMGFQDAPYIIVLHKDKGHQHLHVITSFIGLNGQIIDRGWIGLRGKKIAQKLTEKYGLTPAIKKDLSKTNLQALNNKESTKYELFGIISSALKISKDFNHFQKLLASKKVEIKFKYKRGSETEVQGISFRYKELSFKGSEIDRDFSYKKIGQHFNLVPELNQKSISASTIDFIEKPYSPDSDLLSDLFAASVLPYQTQNEESEEERKRKKRKRKKSIN